MHTSIEDFIFYSRKAKSAEELFSIYEKLLTHYGFDKLAYAVLSDHPSLHNGHPLGLIACNNLNGWDSHYLDKNYMVIDPCPKLTYMNAGVFTWDQIIKRTNLSLTQKNIFHEAGEAQLHHGINVSIHGIEGTKCVAVAASSQKNAHFSHYEHDIINIAAQQFNDCYLSLKDIKEDIIKSPLSPKEEEILKWCSKGFTKSEIGERLNLSHHTINYHMRNILKKLNTKNTTAALVTAIKLGLNI